MGGQDHQEYNDEHNGQIESEHNALLVICYLLWK